MVPGCLKIEPKSHVLYIPGIIPLYHQGFRIYCQYSFNEQESDWLYDICEKISLKNNGVVLLIKKLHMQL